MKDIIMRHIFFPIFFSFISAASIEKEDSSFVRPYVVRNWEYVFQTERFFVSERVEASGSQSLGLLGLSLLLSRAVLGCWLWSQGGVWPRQCAGWQCSQCCQVALLWWQWHPVCQQCLLLCRWSGELGFQPFLLRQQELSQWHQTQIRRCNEFKSIALFMIDFRAIELEWRRMAGALMRQLPTMLTSPVRMERSWMAMECTGDTILTGWPVLLALPSVAFKQEVCKIGEMKVIY